MTSIGKSKGLWRVALWGGAAALLAAPWIAMQFTREVNWTGLDFGVFGGMLLTALLAFEIVARLSGSPGYRAAWGVALLGAFLLVWAELAVGFIGTANDTANWVLLAIPAVWGMGALASLFRAKGMAVTMLAVAVTQAAIGLLALSAGYRILGPTVVFAGLWLLSAGLFYRAAGRA
jgi:hypothetical protein